MIERIPELRELAQTLNFNTAAATLHMSQSTLTHHIAALEADLGFRLFERTPMQITPEGSYYLAAAGKLYDEHEHILEECRSMARQARESVSVNLVHANRSLWGDLIYEAMSLFKERYPEIPAPHTYLQSGMTIEASVYSGAADVGLVFRDALNMPEGFACVKLADYPLAAYFKRTSPLGEKTSLTFSDLESFYLVCPTGPQLRTTFEGAVDAFRRNGIEPKYRVREIEDFGRVMYELEDDEFVFGNNIPGLSDPTTILTARPMTGGDTRYPAYLLYNTASTKEATRLFVQACQEVAVNHQTA